MNKILLIVIAVVVVIGGILVLLGVSSYNSLFTKKEAIEAQWSEVENQLQRRIDMVTQLVGAVQGVLTQEQKVFGDIANARAGLTQALKGGSKQEVIDADNQLTSTLQRIQFLSITEAYPELKSNENVRRLQDEIAGTENRLAVARRDYNQTVQDYNTSRGQFPAVIMAGLLGFEREDNYFKAAPGASEAPKVELNK
ncbi:MAG: LemA family protein [Blastocatellia bacterium]|jgi:LemA protein|nr:LemA family protein [Blastocatellia bacterium]MBK6429080.1 LemA family protein [Blastocatellia bacterium]